MHVKTTIQQEWWEDIDHNEVKYKKDDWISTKQHTFLSMIIRRTSSLLEQVEKELTWKKQKQDNTLKDY